MTIAGFAPAVSVPTAVPASPSVLPSNNAVPFTRSAPSAAPAAAPPPIPSNNAVPFSRPNLPSAAKPLTLTPAAAPATGAAAGIGATAGVAATGFVGGAAIGELARRELVNQGFDNLQYPSNTGELLRDPIGTTIDGVNQTARDLADFFSPEQDPRVNESSGPEFLQQEAVGDPPFRGGQGDGVAYVIRFTFLGEESSSSVIYGPIGSITQQETFPGSPARFVRVTGFDRDGRSTAITVVSGNPDNFDIIGPQRLDGLPDTDGDPPGEITAVPLPSTASVPQIQSPQFAPAPLALPRTAPTTSPAAPASTPSAIPPALPAGLPAGLPAIVPTGLPSGSPTGSPNGLPSSSPQGQPQLQPGSSGQTQGRPASTTSPTSTPRNTPAPLPQPQPQRQQSRQVAPSPFSGCDPCLTMLGSQPNQRPDIEEPDPAGNGGLILEACDGSIPFVGAWQGQGIEGVFNALNFFEGALTFIYEQLKFAAINAHVEVSAGDGSGDGSTDDGASGSDSGNSGGAGPDNTDGSGEPGTDNTGDPAADNTEEPGGDTTGEPSGDGSQEPEACDPCEKLDEVLEKIKELADAVGVDEFPVATPVSFWGDDSTEVEHQNLSQFISWTAQQFDALMGQFPAQIELTNPEGETEMVTLENAAEGLVELYGLLSKVAVDSDYCARSAVSQMIEMASVKNIAIINQDYLEANSEYLGYRGNPQERTVQYSINPRGETPEEVLQPSQQTVIGWRFDDRGTIKDDLIALRYSGGIIKSVFARTASQLVEFGIDQILEEVKNQNSDWEEFKRTVQNPNAPFNNDYPPPRIVDRTSPPNQGDE